MPSDREEEEEEADEEEEEEAGVGGICLPMLDEE